mgnify:CR=1 FL=1
MRYLTKQEVTSPIDRVLKDAESEIKRIMKAHRVRINHSVVRIWDDEPIAFVRRKTITADQVNELLDAVEEYFPLDKGELRHGGKRRFLVNIRHCAIWYIMKNTNYSGREIQDIAGINWNTCYGAKATIDDLLSVEDTLTTITANKVTSLLDPILKEFIELNKQNSNEQSI